MGIPVMVLRNKTNEGRFLAASPDVGDWSDENLDITMQDIRNAYMIVRKDLKPPTAEDFKQHVDLYAELKRVITEKFGAVPFMSLNFEKVREDYEPVNIEITLEEFEYAKQFLEM